MTSTIDGYRVITPNTVIEANDDRFYISYNNYDIGIHGCPTTALVLGQMRRFYILNGDHRKAYKHFARQGLNECIKYFLEHLELKGKYSDYPNSLKELKPFLNSWNGKFYTLRDNFFKKSDQIAYIKSELKNLYPLSKTDLKKGLKIKIAELKKGLKIKITGAAGSTKWIQLDKIMLNEMVKVFNQ